jgi:dihydroorotase-like cyclic amidohydrolase
MDQSYDLVLKGATVVNHDGAGVRDLAVTGGRIAAIGDLAQSTAAEVIDARGLHVLPSVIDTQVHFREPGMTHKEDLTVVDLKRRATITNGWIKSRAGWTPYDGVTVNGWPVATFVRGTRVMWEGGLTGCGRGEEVAFAEAFPGG